MGSGIQGAHSSTMYPGRAVFGVCNANQLIFSHNFTRWSQFATAFYSVESVVSVNVDTVEPQRVLESMYDVAADQNDKFLLVTYSL